MNDTHAYTNNISHIAYLLQTVHITHFTCIVHSTKITMVPQPLQALPLPPAHKDSDTITTTATADGRPAPINPNNRSLSRSQAPIILSPGGKPCLICFDKEKDGVQCPEGHFVCRGCLQVRVYVSLTHMVPVAQDTQIHRQRTKNNYKYTGLHPQLGTHHDPS